MGPRAPGRKAEVEVPGARRSGGGGLRWPFRGHSCGSHATRGGGRRRLGGGESQRRASRRSGRRASWLAPVARREEKRSGARGCEGTCAASARRRLRAGRSERACRQPQVVPAKSFPALVPEKRERVLESDGFLDTLAPTRDLALSYLEARERGMVRSGEESLLDAQLPWLSNSQVEAIGRPHTRPTCPRQLAGPCGPLGDSAGSRLLPARPGGARLSAWCAHLFLLGHYKGLSL